MEQKSIREVAAWTGGRYQGPDLPIAGVSIDSRSTGPGELFIPLRGAKHDGHTFLGEAFASGAAAALVDNEVSESAHRAMDRAVIRVADTRAALGALAAGYRRSLDISVVGITGSNGKTTTKEMLKLMLGGRAAASPRSFNNDVGVPLTLLRADRQHSVCVVEMGTNAPGEIARLAEMARPDIGVVLNVGESHLEGLGDLDGVCEEKFALVGSLSRDGCAILNWDDPLTRSMIERAPGCYTLSFGTWPDADVYGGDLRTRGRELSFKLFNRKQVQMRLMGVHNVHNALAAAAVAMWLGEDPAAVCKRLQAFRPAPMRMDVEDIGSVRLINDAYNSNPRSVEAAIHEVSYRAGGRRVAVLGDMLELGSRALQLHSELGRRMAGRIDVLWAVGPLSEATATAAKKAGVKEVHWSPGVSDALDSLPFQPESRDVVLFKASRGVQLERVYETVKNHLLERRRRRTAKAGN